MEERLRFRGGCRRGRVGRIAEWIIDVFVTSEPRLLGVSVHLYLLPMVGFALVEAANSILGLLKPEPLLIAYELIGPLGFTAGIALIGSVVARELYREAEGGCRRLERRVYSVIDELLIEAPVVETPDHIYLVVFVIVNLLIAFWLLFKPLDVVYVESLRLISEGSCLGCITLLLNLTSTTLFVIFWNIAGLALARFIWVHHHALRVLSDAMEAEMRNSNVLRLDKILMDEIVSRDKPALHFLRFRRRLLGLTEALNKFIRRVLAFSIVAAIVTPLAELGVKGRLTYMSVSAEMIAVGLAVAIVWALYEILKWSSELKTLVLVELRNVRIRAYADGDERLVRTVDELEQLTRELGHTLISSRDLWELIAALITLLATIVSVLARM